MRRPLLAVPFLVLLGLSALRVASTPEPFPAPQGTDWDAVEVERQPVVGNVSVLVGRGGNIGVLEVDGAALLVDDQFEPLADKIRAALGEADLTYLLNTHWHGDHTGGNAAFSTEATILAHRNVRRRLAGDPSIEGRVARPVVEAALPAITYLESLSLHFGGEEVVVLHVGSAHTDGDSVVWFTQSNVVHMGDVYFSSSFPYIDLASGGDVEGMIEAVHRVLETVEDDARIIPGHGPVTGTDELREYVGMLEESLARVRRARAEGQGPTEMLEAGLLGDMDARWGQGPFVDPARWLAILNEWLGS